MVEFGTLRYEEGRAFIQRQWKCSTYLKIDIVGYLLTMSTSFDLICSLKYNAHTWPLVLIFYAFSWTLGIIVASFYILTYPELSYTTPCYFQSLDKFLTWSTLCHIKLYVRSLLYSYLPWVVIHQAMLTALDTKVTKSYKIYPLNWGSESNGHKSHNSRFKLVKLLLRWTNFILF